MALRALRALLFKRTYRTVFFTPNARTKKAARAAARWATEDEIHRMIDEGTFIPYHHSLITLLFALRSKRGTIAKE